MIGEWSQFAIASFMVIGFIGTLIGIVFRMRTRLTLLENDIVAVKKDIDEVQEDIEKNYDKLCRKIDKLSERIDRLIESR